MRLRRLVFALFCLVGVISVAAADTEPWLRRNAAGEPQVQLYFFWSLTCPHCQEARPHVEALARRLPWLQLHSLELTREPENQRRFLDLVGQMHQEAAVPAFVFCGEMRVGWQSADTTGAELAAALTACRQRALADDAPAPPSAAAEAERIHVPGFGDTDAAALSLPLLTLLLAGLDAFNPCAFFVLLFLLSMMAHQRSHARMLVVGGIFVLFSGLMYFAFMAAWLSVFQLLGQLAWVTAAAGAVAVLVGALNVKDFFVLRQGPSLSISDAGRQDIFRRMRTILAAERLLPMLAATAFLAVAANFYELLCTAGFPMVFTRVLTLSEPSVAARYLYLVLYNVIYVLPLAAIVALFARTLAARKLDERQGRLLKLLSGVMMVELGALLLIAPQHTASALAGGALIAVAVGVTWMAARMTGS
jgi:cytochrome c biogenesis protein CcdA